MATKIAVGDGWYYSEIDYHAMVAERDHFQRAFDAALSTVESQQERIKVLEAALDEIHRLIGCLYGAL